MQRSNENTTRQPHRHRQTRILRQVLLMTALTGIHANAHADNGDIEWNGFLNIIGGALKQEPVTDFNDTKQYPGFQGYESDFTFDSQTSAGLQAQKHLDEKTSVTMQIYSEGDIDNYKANLKWLYLTYSPEPHSRFRIGRIGTPVYYYSDSLNIGYSYHWVQPPEPVYPFDTTITGIDYIYEDVWRDIEWSAEVLTGSDDEYQNVVQSRIITRNNFGLAFTASTDNWLSFRAMYYRADTTFEIDTLNEDSVIAAIEAAVVDGLALRGLTPEQIQAALPAAMAAAQAKILDEDFNTADFEMEYLAFALRAETERWLLMSEVSTIQTDVYIFGDIIGRYITGGMRFGSVLYYLSLADSKPVPHDKVRQDIAYTLPENPGPVDYIDQLEASFNTTVVGSFARSIKTASVGARMEMSANTAIKIELMRIDEQPLFHGDTYSVGKNMLFRTALNATF